MAPCSTACSVGSTADQSAFSRPRAPIQELVSAPAAPMPTVWTKPRRVSAMMPPRFARRLTSRLGAARCETRPSPSPSRPSSRSRSARGFSRTAGSRGRSRRLASRTRRGNPLPVCRRRQRGSFPANPRSCIRASPSALRVKARTSVLRSRSASMCSASPSAAIAAATPKTLTLYGIFSFSSGFIVSARPIA